MGSLHLSGVAAGQLRGLRVRGRGWAGPPIPAARAEDSAGSQRRAQAGPRTVSSLEGPSGPLGMRVSVPVCKGPWGVAGALG